MSMTIPEAHAEIRKHYDAAAAIESKYPSGLSKDINAEDATERDRLLETIDGLEEKLAGLEDADQKRRRILDEHKRRSQPAQRHEQPEVGESDSPKSVQMFGQQFIESEEYKRIVQSGVLNNPSTRVEFGIQLKGQLLDYLCRKALVYSGSGVGGPLIQNDRLPGINEILQRPLSILDMVPTARTTSNTIEYLSESTNTNNAAFVAESSVTTGTTGLKPESALAFSLATSPVSTVAEWLPVTNQMLADAPAIDGLIRSRLIQHLSLKLEDGIISGSGTPPDLRGMLSTVGIQTLGVVTNFAEAALKAMTQIRVTGLGNPEVVIMHPSAWEALRKMRENVATGTLGQYLYGPPSQVGPMTLWGVPIIQSLGLPATTVVVANLNLACMLFDREQAAIRVGTVNDQLIRNQTTILAELRAAFVVFRPPLIAQITGVS